ncbi:MAG: efflux RND transporter periplasmic adaptor subunit, partial [Pirellulaceae bacterium]|nr:efflux RND transporter periplasmic adaptor subunit [Pirellulaceae bacterium]
MRNSRITRRLALGGLGIVALTGVAATAWWVATNTVNQPTSNGLLDHDSTMHPATQPGANKHADVEQDVIGRVRSRDQPIPVRVYQVRAAGPSTSAELTGNVRARYQTDIAFRVSGKILSRHVEVGDQVAAGQLLFELDPEDYHLQQKTAEANLQVAKASVLRFVAEEKRLMELRRTNAVSASEYEIVLSDRDMALGKQESAAKQLELANNQLTYCHLVADQAGIVVAISAEAGQVVPMGSAICSIAQTQELEAVVDIPENRWPEKSTGETTARFWSLPGVPCAVRLREIAPTADPITRTYRARFTLLNPPPAVKLGMTVSVSLENGTADKLFEIPASSIIQSAGQPAVWRVEADGRIVAV